MSNRLEQEISHYRIWRDELIGAVGAYQAWIDKSGRFDPRISLRIYDLLESLKHDRLVLAFVAEFSRGKTELINALFFADFKQRLLPSDVGRTTMCPTEIFHDSRDAPYIRLLPIESRLRDESINTLKKMPVEWSKISLDIDSTESMLAALQTVAETKQVPIAQAQQLGLWNSDDLILQEMVKENGLVDIPTWRYALVNYPHPLLQSGLTILDTPGLNALGAEPELTLSAIPNAHAVLFLLATDTGVTKSDLEIWNTFVKQHVEHRLAILNKIDILWDELKSPAQIEATIRRQLETTARQLNIPQAHVLAVSAQKALLAKIRDDAALLRRCGIGALERMLAEQIIPAKQHILHVSVLREIGAMADTSLQSVDTQLASTVHELRELNALSGKNRGVVEDLRNKVIADKHAYDESVQHFNITRSLIVKEGNMLLAHLQEARLEDILQANRAAIEGSWTTSGLTQGMHNLLRQVGRDFDKIYALAHSIKALLNAAYQRFHAQHGFKKKAPPALSLEIYREKLVDLLKRTDDFCRDPVNIMTEKHFLIKKFHIGLVTQAHQVFQQARHESEAWLRGALEPLMMQIREHKTALEQRSENLQKILDNIETLQERIDALTMQQTALGKESETLSSISTRLKVGPPRRQVAE
jgi:hypothetical protein